MKKTLSSKSKTITKHFKITNIENGRKVPCTSYNGKNYFLTIVDEYSRYVTAITLKNKMEVPPNLIKTINYLETQTGNKVKRIHSDGGTEFMNDTVKKFCSGKGINHTSSTPYSPWHNGIAERFNGLLESISRSLLSQCDGNMKLWSFSIEHAALLLNVTPKKV